MKRLSRPSLWVLWLAGLWLVLGCSGALAADELSRLALDEVGSIGTVIAADETGAAEGRAAIRIETLGPASICLGQVTGLDVDQARLVYQAKVKCRGLEGNAFLEMWVYFGKEGPFFSRGLNSTVSGSSDWTALETPFLLRAGQKPTRITFNVYVNGSGTVWVDDIRLLKLPLP